MANGESNLPEVALRHQEPWAGVSDTLVLSSLGSGYPLPSRVQSPPKQVI